VIFTKYVQQGNSLPPKSDKSCHSGLNSASSVSENVFFGEGGDIGGFPSLKWRFVIRLNRGERSLNYFLSL